MIPVLTKSCPLLTQCNYLLLNHRVITYFWTTNFEPYPDWTESLWNDSDLKAKPKAWPHVLHKNVCGRTYPQQLLQHREIFRTFGFRTDCLFLFSEFSRLDSSNPLPLGWCFWRSLCIACMCGECVSSPFSHSRPPAVGKLASPGPPFWLILLSAKGFGFPVSHSLGLRFGWMETSSLEVFLQLIQCGMVMVRSSQVNFKVKHAP